MAAEGRHRVEWEDIVADQEDIAVQGMLAEGRHRVEWEDIVAGQEDIAVQDMLAEGHHRVVKEDILAQLLAHMQFVVEVVQGNSWDLFSNLSS